MIRHYLKIAFRNLLRQKVLSFINVIGLSLGLACFSLFLLFAVNEFSYNRFYKDAGRIFRVTQWWAGSKDREPGGTASMYTPFGPALKKDFADVQEFARFKGGEQKFIKANDKVLRSDVSFADPQVLKIFSFPFLAGNATNALKDPDRIVLTKTTALQIFGETDVVGKRVDIKMDDAFEPFTVGAVTADIPANSTVQFQILGSFNYITATSWGKESEQDWNMTIGIETFVQLRDGSKLMNEPERLAKFRHRYYPEEESELKKEGLWNAGPLPVSFRLQPLRDIHVNATIEDGPETIDPKNIWILLSIAGAVLLIACINFTTLSIGRSAGRAKEVGVRKVVGSSRKTLLVQFLSESVMLSIISAGIGVLLVYLLLPYFNHLAGRSLSFSFDQFPEISWLMPSLIIVVGILAGSYPALVLSGFNPLEVLKSKVKVGGSNIFIKSLVSFQFVLSIGLIIATIIILQQLSFLRSKNLGFNKENIVVIDAAGTDAKKVFPLFALALKSNPSVIGQTASEIGLGEGAGQMGGGYEFNGEMKGVIEYPVDAGFLPVMGMRLIAGRNFDARTGSDTSGAVIINEVLAQQLGAATPADAIGKQLRKASKRPGSAPPKTIIGVIKDFNFEPLHRSVRSQLFLMPPVVEPRKFFVRIKPENLSRTITYLEATWKSIVPDLPFKYSFLDEDFNRFYKSEAKWCSIISWASTVSIFLACLGLFGLAALAAVNRQKEVGIRKILGASLVSIVTLLSKDFLKLVALALLIASPVTWYFMNKWLQDFVYRIDIGYLVFAFAGLLTLFIALITVSFKAIKAGISNPVKSLRTE